MKEQILDIKRRALENLKLALDVKEIENIRVSYLGKKGKLTLVLREMGKLSAEERPVMGALANEVRAKIESELNKKTSELNKVLLEKKLIEERVDITLNSDKLIVGHEHPLIKTLEELEDLFIKMGFRVYDGPEVESVENNFDLLNAPKNHPSRDLSDTFYINENTLLRTQTSPVQIRAMKEYGAPLRMVCSGRVFRSDEVDATHSPMFHQLEGLIVDKNISLANLFETLNIFVKTLFGDDMKTRFRPHYFPFTEPSAEVDVTCTVCGGKGCSACNHTGWSMELLGCGMVHPNVLRNCGIDPEVYSGFAFGMGIDRIAMVKYGISDIRMLFDNDNRFLNQF
ncbi:phenylalanine--tRNA ligase subunit alpha [Peptoniphilus sp. oral taxon 386]|uniref:phenylalanine--tRNA ligase subunit alpha n=1 Tax=Peptoniphilus sp. oral taxon 386 TaxID=652713 RepID=UPI0001DA9B3C|nr:phenylalanine--tRNA ligase subunit alpha [Peptoniphilus sp. oral taxon 386]EFI42134.1 phenylalanine--tRNA ligase, alpha subunit [Peptoniphilus sp. oral taxon 386 str. F0131]